MKKVTAEIIEQCQLLVTVKVKDDATNEDIEKAINAQAVWIALFIFKWAHQSAAEFTTAVLPTGS